MAINTARFDLDSKVIVGELRELFRQIKDKDNRLKILRKAAVPVKNRAQRIPAIGKPRGGRLKGAASATYRTAKLIGGIRAPRGRGTITALYYPFNLRRSIQMLPLKKTDKVVLGPRIRRKSRRKTYGKSEASANAFYAQMVYGSARAFGKEVMIRALQGAQGQVVATIRKETGKLIDREKAKRGF